MTTAIQQRQDKLKSLKRRFHHARTAIPKPLIPDQPPFFYTFPANFTSTPNDLRSPVDRATSIFDMEHLARGFNDLLMLYSNYALLFHWTDKLYNLALRHLPLNQITWLYFTPPPLAAPPVSPEISRYGAQVWRHKHIIDAAQEYIRTRPTLAESNIKALYDVSQTAASMTTPVAEAEQWWITNVLWRLKAIAPTQRELRDLLLEATQKIIRVESLNLDFHKDLVMQAADRYFIEKRPVTEKLYLRIMDAAVPKEALRWDPKLELSVPSRRLSPQKVTFHPNLHDAIDQIWQIYAQDHNPKRWEYERWQQFVVDIANYKSEIQPRIREEWWNEALFFVRQAQRQLPERLRDFTNTDLMTSTAVSYPSRTLAAYYHAWERLLTEKTWTQYNKKTIAQYIHDALSEYDLMDTPGLAENFNRIFFNLHETNEIPWIRPTSANISRIKNELFRLLPTKPTADLKALATHPMIQSTLEQALPTILAAETASTGVLVTINKVLLATSILEATAIILAGKLAYTRALTPTQRQLVDSVDDPDQQQKLKEYLQDMNQLLYKVAKDNLPYDPKPEWITIDETDLTLTPDNIVGNFRITNRSDYPLIFRCHPNITYIFAPAGYFIIDAKSGITVDFKLIIPAPDEIITRPPLIIIENYIDERTIQPIIIDPQRQIPRTIQGPLTFLHPDTILPIPWFIAGISSIYKHETPESIRYFTIRNDTGSDITMAIDTQDKNFFVNDVNLQRNHTILIPKAQNRALYAATRKPPKRRHTHQRYQYYQALFTYQAYRKDFAQQWAIFAVPVED